MENPEQLSTLQTPASTPIPKSSFPKTIIIICALLLAAGAVFGFWVKTSPEKEALDPQDLPPSPIASDFTEAIPTLTPDSSLSADDQKVCETYTPTSRQLSGQIAWAQAQEITPLDIFSSAPPDVSFDPSYTRENSKFYKVGQVQTGSYKDYEVILADIAVEGPAFYPNYYRFLSQGSKVVGLGKYNPELSEWDGFDHSKFTLDNAFSVAELDYPETFQGATNRENFEKDPYATFNFCGDGLVKLFHHAVLGNVYTSPLGAPADAMELAKNQYSQGFYLASADGTTKVYKLVVDFVAADNVPQVTWADGGKNTAEYTFTDIGGCGSMNYLSVVSADKVNPQTDIIEAGTNSFGDKIYTLKDPNHPLVKEIYENQYYVYQGEKIAYEEFVKSRPVFFWYNPFGRLVKFQNNRFVPLAECGKPVIYLYPQTPQNVRVELSPQGGFSASEPAYNSGWQVVASPSGELLNQADGKTYPYLFWEGRGGLYHLSDKGFVVASANVHAFLLEKLAKLGLNAKETADFIEFWEPRMQAAPYYFITFFGNSVMDYLAPLTVTPVPDTVIRVLMDFKPLAEPIESRPYEIRTPMRRGFTVVEWGGVLR